MTRTALLALLLTASALAGCTGDDDAAGTRLVIDFPQPREDVDAGVTFAAMQGLEAVDGTAHAQLLAWSQASGTPVSIASFDFGHCLDAIDALPSPGGCQPGAQAFWSLSVNGQEAQAGMDQVLLADGDEVRWTYTPLDAASSPAGPALTVDPPAPTQQDMLMLTGTVDRAARVSVTGADPVDAQAGEWMVHVPLPYGRTPLLVTADDGTASSQTQVVAIRLASATFEARFTMAVPPHPAISDLVWYDPDELASAALYNGTAAAHPPHANVHDLMVAWERQSGKTITYSDPSTFGFGVDEIDGVGQPLSSSAPPYWCYKLNGESASLGISAQELAPGDVVTWEYAGCA